MTQYFSGDKIRKNGIYAPCSAYGEEIGVFRVLVGIREGKRPLGYPAYNHTANNSNNNNNNNINNNNSPWSRVLQKLTGKQHFMEPEGSLLHSQFRANCRYLEPA